MAMRLSGLMSGMDTESIVSELVAVKQVKVDDLKKAQQKQEWKQEAWKNLNKKVYDLFKGSLDKLCLQASYKKKMTNVSNPNAAKVITGENAMNSVQSLKIKQMAASGYMTGAKIAKDGVTANSTMQDLLGADIFKDGTEAKINVSIGGVAKEVSIKSDMKISDFATEVRKQGLNVNFDEATKRMFIGAEKSGVAHDFNITGNDELGNKLLDSLGITEQAGAIKQDGKDAIIELNGATFTSESNTIEVNGLTITCMEEMGNNTITLSTQDDTSGMYDMIKDFIVEYSSLINEMDKLYNADAAKGYEPLTDDEKYEMSEKEVEKWEEKIKDSLLRRDSNLGTVANKMKQMMSAGYEVDGQMMYLSDFGVETMGYFNAKDNEKNMYHIFGDKDDSMVSSKHNKLMSSITSNPDQVVDFFSQMARGLKTSLDDMMKSTDYRSLYSVYDDKKMQKEYDKYTAEIKKAEKKLMDYESKWYKKFSNMETMMAKMQENANAITGLLGG